jgi:hypothetical protein
MKQLLLIGLLCLGYSSLGQTVFFEDFAACANAGVTASGSDNVGAVAWTTTCPGSIAASDYFQCNGGQLEAQDTNGPESTWTTGVIDISTCIGSEITFDLSETGNLEECINCGGTGNTCIDFVRLEYNLDGNGWIQMGGQTCGVTLTAGNNHIQIGDITGGSIAYVSPCIDFGNQLEIRIICMSWGADERWRFDNITVSCNDCVLPVKFKKVEVELIGRSSILSWSTASEFDNSHFIIERSMEGSEYLEIGQVQGAGESSSIINYQFRDENAGLYSGKTLYYRIKQIGFNGNTNYSKIRSLKIPPGKISYNFDNKSIQIQSDQFSNSLKMFNIFIYDLSGKKVFSILTSGNTEIPWAQKGLFIVSIPELGWNDKLIVP